MVVISRLNMDLMVLLGKCIVVTLIPLNVWTTIG